MDPDITEARRRLDAALEQVAVVFGTLLDGRIEPLFDVGMVRLFFARTLPPRTGPLGDPH